MHDLRDSSLAASKLITGGQDNIVVTDISKEIYEYDPY